MARKQKILKREKGLSDREEMFCREMLIDGNQTEAAIRAGYPKASAHVRACELMKNPLVRSAIKYHKDKMLEKIDLKAEDVLRQLFFWVSRTSDEFIDPETGLVVTDLRLLSIRAKNCVDGIKQKVETWVDDEGNEHRKVETDLKLVSKAVAGDMLMRHWGQYMKDNQQKSQDVKVNIDFSKLLEDRRDAPDEVEQKIIDVEPKRIVEQPKYGLKELMDGEGMEDADP